MNILLLMPIWIGSQPARHRQQVNGARLMKRDNINYLVVGFFVLGILALLLVGLYRLTGSAGPSDYYTVIYDNVAGIKFGTQVLYEGYPVGQVEAVIPQPGADGMQYQLQLSVIQNWQIPEDSVASVVASGLLSSMTIEIEEGDSDTMLPSGSVIAGREAVNLFAVVNDLAAEFKQLSDESLQPLLNTLTNNINHVAEELVKLTRDDVRPLLTEIRAKLNNSDLVEQADALLVKLNRSADSLELLLNQKNRKQMARTLDNLYTASDSLDTLLMNIGQTRDKLDTMLTGINGLVSTNEDNLQMTISQLRTTLDTVATNIGSIMYHLEGTSRNMHELSRHLRANPGALLRSSAPVDEANREAQQ